MDLSSASESASKPKMEFPFDHEHRQRPVHPDLPEFKVPSGDMPTYSYNPITCEPWTEEELKAADLRPLQDKYADPATTTRAIEETVQDLKAHLAANEHARREIDREMQEAEKTRAVERKIYMQQGKGKKTSA